MTPLHRICWIQYQPDDVAVILVERNQRYLEGLDTVFGLRQEPEEEQGS